MKETVLDVLMYIFDNYIEEDIEFVPDQESLKDQLVEAGFRDQQIEKAFAWLEGLATYKTHPDAINLSELPSLRLFSSQELDRLDAECRGFLLFLEQAKVLNSHERELVIDRIMALESDDIDLQQLKWVVLMVLFNQPDKEAAITWMEDIVMDDINANLH
jgi:Smg protein